ncbi:MAG: hypothetical protein KAI79_11280 [Bacteroidales bacterium]|nr:hypothetical protein [Bacteroidales bacterium]
MQKGIYLPTKQNTIILNELEEYCEILLDGEYKTVSKDDIEFETSQTNLSSLDALKENSFLNGIKNPLSGILSEHIIFLTATPVQNTLSDLLNILSLLYEDYLKDYDYFEKE